MAGFLSFLAPLGESLGGTVQNVSQQSQQQQQRTAYGKLLEGLGPEYKGVQEAFNSGASVHDISAFIGGPLGEELRQRHQSEQLAQIFQNPEDYKDPTKLRQAYAQGLLPESVGAKLFGDSDDTPKSEYERYIHDQLGMSLEGYRALPQEVRDKDYQTFLDQTKKKQGAQPLGQGSTGDPGFDAYLAANPGARQLGYDKAWASYKKETSLTGQEKTALDSAQATIPALDHMLEAGKGVLPDKPGWGAVGAKFDRWVRTGQGYPELTRFQQSKTAEIDMVMSIARSTRISQLEIDKVIGGLESATTYPALEVAVNDAKRMLQTSISILKYRSMGPMDGNEASWSGNPYADALNSSTEGATGFESSP